jgi:isoleucyl-tRNA synthetase
VIDCEKCGGTMRRVPEVIDCWFDSGSMPFAQYHYPFENQDVFRKHFPADFISEAIDQTRGWFYTLLAISTLLFDVAPFKNCIVLGHVNDKDGNKMSKHKGNVVDPDPILEKQGADAVRWYFYSGSAPWLPSRFYEEAVSESQRKFMGTLWNTYSFYVLYANIDGFDPSRYSLDSVALTIMDRWILSRLNTLISAVDKNLENYRITESARAIEDFTDELSNWYVRRGRERYWVSALTDDKIAAFLTLYTVLVELSKLIAPFVPFLADEIYQNLVRSVHKDAPESVHLCDFPAAETSMIDPELEKNMELVLRLVALGRACRAASAIKNRQPLAAMYVKSGGEKVGGEYIGLLEDELNVKKVIFTDSDAAFVTYAFKPQLKTVGKKYGKLVPRIKEELEAANGDEKMKELSEKGFVTVDIDGQTIEMSRDELLIETKKTPGFASESDRELTVALDINLTPELIEEGFVREVINKLQTMRKEARFEVLDRIEVTYRTTEKLERIIEKNREEISGGVLAVEIKAGEPQGYVAERDINGETALIGIKKVQ